MANKVFNGPKVRDWDWNIAGKNIKNDNKYFIKLLF